MTIVRHTNEIQPAAIFDRRYGFGFYFWYPAGGSGAG